MRRFTFIIFICLAIIGVGEMQSQTNKKVVRYREYEQGTPVILKLPNQDLLGNGYGSSDCYFVWHNGIAVNQGSWNSELTAYYNRFDKFLNGVIGNEGGLMSDYLNAIPNKLNLYIKDANYITMTDNSYVICGQINWPSVTNGYEGFIIIKDLYGNYSNLVIYDNLEAINSTINKDGDSFIFCGTKKQYKDEPKKGVIFELDLPNITVTWSWEFWADGDTEFDIKDTELNKIKRVSKSSYVAVGTTNMSNTEADLLIVSISPTGFKTISAQSFGESYDEKNRIGHFEYGESFVGFLNDLKVVGRYEQTEDPNGSNTPIYKDMLLAGFEYEDNTDAPWSIVWAKRYNFYKGKPFIEKPEDIILNKDFLTVVGNLEYTNGLHDGFIFESEGNGAVHDFTVFGTQTGDDKLYSICHSYDKGFVAAGISDSYSSTTSNDLWLVEKVDNDTERCDDIKASPESEDIKLRKKTVEANEFVVSVGFESGVLGFNRQDYQDSMFCKDANPPCADYMPECVTNSLNLSTGWDPYKINPGITGGNVDDPVWMLVSAPNGATGLPKPARVLQTPVAWANPLSNSMYISAYSFPSCNTDNLGGTPYEFVRSVCSCEGDSAVLSLKLYADNHAIVFWNHQQVLLTNPSAPTSNFLGNPFTATVKVALNNQGCDTLRVHLFNDGETYMGVDLQAYISGAWFVKDECCECLNHGSSISGHKYWDKDQNGYYNNQDEFLDGWDITLQDQNGNLVGQTTTDINGFYIFDNLTPGSYEVCEVPQSGWTNVSPGNNCKTVVIATEHQHENVNFGNYQTPATICQIETFDHDSLCCCYWISIINPENKNIQTLELTTTGGQIKSWDHSYDCGQNMTQNLPDNHLIWDFNPDCIEDIYWQVCFKSETDDGWVYSDWVVTFDDDTQCEYSDSIHCTPAPVTQCDIAEFSPFHDLNYSNEHILNFKITNMRVPNEPICKIYINYDPPVFQGSSDQVPSTGGVLKYNGASVSPAPGVFDHPYHEIDLTAAGITCSYGDYIEFNHGFDFTRNWSGTISIVIEHCNGEICDASSDPSLATTFEVEYPIQHKNMAKATERHGYYDSLYCVVLDAVGIEKGFKVGGISLSLLGEEGGGDAGSELIAISGAKLMEMQSEIEPNSISRSLQGKKSALFEFAKPVEMSDNMEPLRFNLVFGNNERIPENVTIGWVMYDEKGRVVDGDSLEYQVVTSVKSIIESSAFGAINNLNAFPNPTSGLTTITFNLAYDCDLNVQLYDEQGKFLKNIYNGFNSAGKNSLEVTTNELASGMYFVNFRTSDGNYASIKLIVEK